MLNLEHVHFGFATGHFSPHIFLALCNPVLWKPIKEDTGLRQGNPYLSWIFLPKYELINEIQIRFFVM